MSWSAARAVFTYTAPSGRASNCARPMSPTVSGVTTACISPRAASAQRSSSVCVASGWYGSAAITFIPRPSRRQRAARPTAPRPTTPAVRPASCHAR